MNTDKKTEMIWWIAKHRRLMYALGFICMVILDAYLMSFNIPVWLVFVIVCVPWVCYCRYVDSCPQRAQVDSLRELSLWCDPNPLLRDTDNLLDYKHGPVNRAIVSLNHSLAWRELGEYGKAYEQMIALKKKMSKRMNVLVKFTLLNNLADACTMLGRYDEAEHYYENLLEMYRNMPEKKRNAYNEQSVREAKADHFYRQGEYGQVLELLASVKPYNLKEEVSVSLLQAKAYLKLGDMEKAREKLDYVIKKGNKLYAVTEAKQLMETIHNGAESEER